MQANRIHAAQGRADTNALAAQARALFAQDAAIAAEYHAIAGGKWNHMMDQTHIGYTSWRDPATNIMPEVREIALPAAAALGVAVEGGEAAWPAAGTLRLPAFEPFDKATRRIAVFDRGAAPLAWTAHADQPWVVLSQSSGNTGTADRIAVDVRWDAVPPGATVAHVRIDGADGQTATVEVPLAHARCAHRGRARLRGERRRWSRSKPSTTRAPSRRPAANGCACRAWAARCPA